MNQRKVESVPDPGLELRQDLLDEVLLPADACEDRQILIASEPRFTPMQNRDPAYEAKRPVAMFAESLNLQRGFYEPARRGCVHVISRKDAAFPLIPNSDLAADRQTGR